MTRFIVACAALTLVAACADLTDDPAADGSACVIDAQCASRICLTAADGWPGGLCARACATTCEDGLACVLLEDGALCMPPCTTASQCRSGWVCAASVGACLPDCRSGWSCGAYACDQTTGACALPTSVGAANGSACTADATCSGGVCVGVGSPGAVCAAPCTDGACATGETCTRLGDSLLCLPACESATCASGLVCAASAGVCLPDCRAGWSCGSALVCSDGGTCELPTDPGAAVGEPCAADMDCAGGVCIGSETGAGVCAAPCASGECPAGQTCARLGDHLLCVPACTAGTPCTGALVCSESLAACLPDCRDGWSCGVLQCDAQTGVCGLPTIAGGEVGDPCATSAACTSTVCFAATRAGAPTGWTGGMCVAPCIDGACPSSQSCVVLNQTPLCVPACAGGCREGYVCSPGVDACLPDCRDGWPCGDGFTCGDDGRCRVPSGVAAPLGSACASGAGCESGICFEATDGGVQTGWKDGTCAAPCGSTACGGAQGCVVLDGGSWCLPPCVTGGCRDGYVCSTDLDICLPDCRQGWSCGGAFTCGDDGQCRIELPTLLAVGDPCTSHAQCTSGACLVPPDNGNAWVYGMCTQPCTTTCPTDFICAPLGLSKLCVPACTPGCPTGYVCSQQGQACVPSCQLGFNCPPGVTCSQGGQCQGGPGPGGP